jgi:diguanylate cyclase (GGDEF)-like protein
MPPMWRRVALVMTLVMVVALSVAGWASVRAITAQIDRDDATQVSELAAQFVPVFRSRLHMADAWVRYLTATEPGTDEQSLRARVLATGTLAGVVLVPLDERSAGGLPSLATSDRLALTAGRSVLKIVPSAPSAPAAPAAPAVQAVPATPAVPGRAGVYLAHLVTVAGAQQIGFFQLAPVWLWRDLDQVPGRMGLAVVDAGGSVIFAGAPLASGVPHLLVRAPIDARHPARAVVQGWQQDGTAWRGAVAQLRLDDTPIAGDGVWNIAVYDKAIDAWPALFSLVPMMLVLLLLGALCVLFGTWYLSRRWQPALTRVHAALDQLRQGVFAPVEVGWAADAPRVVAQSYNLAVAELQRRFAAQGYLAEIDRLLLEAEELEQALEPILARVCDLTGAQTAAVALVDRDAAAHARSFTVSADGGACPISRVNIDEEMAQQLRESPQASTVPSHHLDRYGFLEPLRALGARSCCVWPVMVGERIAAILSVGYGEVAAPLAPQLSFGTECAARLRTALDNAERGERLYHQAHFDSLTSLPNRLLFHDRLSQELKNVADNDQRSALLYIDLDHFKKVNDSVGHVAGDQLLTIVAQRLRACVKEGDTVARLGGDEFTVILRNLPSGDVAGTIAERIIEALQRPVNIAGRDHFVRASIGITLFPDDANTIEAVMRNADLAMYHAKDGGRARALFFDSTMTRALAPVAQSGLFRALRRREFALHYQPQFDLRTGAVAAVEALLRWQSPREGVRLPHDFIPAAEESGLIVDIGTWVLESGCHQLAIWRDDGIAPVRLALNVSVQQLRLADFTNLVRRSLERASLTPGVLELEVTETVFADEAARQTLRALSELGVRLALDDFGTGYSSLNHLRQHPVDAIKIDRSLMQEVPDDPKANSLAASIIDMAHALGKQVVAEGVETLPQLDFLRERGCELAQGYVLARPLGVAEVSELLSSRQGLELLLRRAAG